MCVYGRSRIKVVGRRGRWVFKSVVPCEVLNNYFPSSYRRWGSYTSFTSAVVPVYHDHQRGADGIVHAWGERYEYELGGYYFSSLDCTPGLYCHRTEPLSGTTTLVCWVPPGTRYRTAAAGTIVVEEFFVMEVI